MFTTIIYSTALFYTFFFLDMVGTNMLYWSMEMSLVSLYSYKFSQNIVLFWINTVKQMHHGPSEVLWYWLKKEKTKTSIHIQTFGKWLNLCLLNSNFVWGKDMHIKHTVGLICSLAFIEGLVAHYQAETGWAVFKNYISSNASIYT